MAKRGMFLVLIHLLFKGTGSIMLVVFLYNISTVSTAAYSCLFLLHNLSGENNSWDLIFSYIFGFFDSRMGSGTGVIWERFSHRVWVNLRRQLSTRELFTCFSPCQGVGERTGRVKVRQLMGRDNDSLICLKISKNCSLPTDQCPASAWTTAAPVNFPDSFCC